MQQIGGRAFVVSDGDTQGTKESDYDEAESHKEEKQTGSHGELCEAKHREWLSRKKKKKKKSLQRDLAMAKEGERDLA